MDNQDQPQSVTSKADLRKWRTELPNLYDDADLDPYEFRLLAHYVRVGDCYEGTRKTAEKCKMSAAQVVEKRRSLEKKGFIILGESQIGTVSIEIVDIWQKNFDSFSERSRGKRGVHHMNAGCSPHERKKELIEERTKEEYPEGGAKNAPPPEPPKAEKLAKPKADLFPIASTLSDVCQMPLEINRGRLFREAKQLCAAAVVPPVTPDEIRARYGPGGWWYREDWRGQKGEPPTPAVIKATWGQWTVPKVIPLRRDTKAAKLEDTFARWDAEAGNGNTTNHNGDPQEIFECVSFTVT